MKQRLRYFCLLCILASFPLAFIWATWEGNAGTGAASDFPGSGLYARSDMFPRNTLVQIENLETGSVVRAVITGSSGVPGLVAVLSPDTASALNIRQGTVARVRIHIPSPVSERPAPGTLATGDRLTVDDPDVNPDVAVTDADIDAAGADPAGSLHNPVIPLAAIAEEEEYPLIPVPEEMQEETFDDALASGEIPPEEESTVPGEMMDDAAVTASAEDAAVVEDDQDMHDETAMVQEEAPDPASTDTSQAVYDEPQLVIPGEDEPGTVDSVTLEPAEPMPPESDDTEVPVVEAPPVFAAIAIPPEAPPMEDAPVIDEAPLVDEAPIIDEPSDSVSELLPEPVTAQPGPSEKPAVYTGDIPVVDRLEKGAYYVQIAVYRDALNTRNVLERFGKTYPILVQKGSSAGKAVMKVSVGPLKKDEYGAILEYFQKNGFADAFVRQE